MSIFLIYAAGDSIRIKKKFNIEHKGLLEINRKPLISHQLEWIGNYNPKKIILVVNARHKKFIQKISLYKKKLPIKFIYNNDVKSKNMKSFYLAKNEIQNNNVIFTTSDLYCEKNIIDVFMNDNSQNKILIDSKINKYKGDEVLISIKNNYINRCSKKLNKYNGIAIGIYSFESKIINKMINYCEKNHLNGYFDKSLYYAIDNVINCKFKTKPIIVSNELWFDIDTFDEYINAKNLLNEAK